MDNEKLFEFMEKMYSEMQTGFKAVNERFDDVDRRFDDVDRRFVAVNERFDAVDKRFAAVNERFDAVDERFDTVTQRLGALESGQLRLENSLEDMKKTLFDGYTQNTEKLNAIDDKVDNLKIEVNSISMKTTYNDSRIIEISKDLKKAK